MAAFVAALDRPLTSAITCRPCVLYRAEVVLHPGRATAQSLVDRDGRDFELEDGDTRVRVRWSPDVDLLLDEDAQDWSTFVRDPPPSVQMLLEQRRWKWRGPYFNAPLAWCEGVIEPGEEVVVLGRLEREVDADAGAGSYREPPTRLVLVAEAVSDVASVIAAARR